MKVAFAAVDRSAREPRLLPATLTATLITFSVTGIVSDWSTTFGNYSFMVLRRVKGTSKKGDGRCTMCTLDLNGSTRARRHDECPMAKQTCKERKQEDRLKSEGLVVLSSLNAGHEISSRILERRLRKLKGIKEIITNPISRTVKIRYDPRVVSADKMRSILKNG